MENSKEVFLDGSFIISCVRKRIDFLSDLENQGFRPVVPKEVLQEMKDVRLRDGVSHEDRLAIDVAFQLIEQRKVKKVSLGNGKVDDRLIEKGNEGFFIATLDAAIKNKVPKKIAILSSKNTVGIV